MATTDRLAPRILERPAQTMAVVTSKGDPSVVGEQVFSALYGAVYGLKMRMKKAGQGDFKVSGLRARWPDAHLVPRDEWSACWALPIPADAGELPQKDPDMPVKMEVWEYGTVAEILHIGSYSDEGPAVELLHRFIEESGYEMTGTHEEEYVTSHRAKVQKTIIRQPVRRVTSDQ